MSLDDRLLLVVEDEPIIALALEDLLCSCGARVVLTGGVEQGLEILETEPVDAAILDVNLHGALSYPLASRLRERAIPYIFATGNGVQLHPPEFAAVPTVSKPYSLKAIQKALEEAGI